MVRDRHRRRRRGHLPAEHQRGDLEHERCVEEQQRVGQLDEQRSGAFREMDARRQLHPDNDGGERQCHQEQEEIPPAFFHRGDGEHGVEHEQDDGAQQRGDQHVGYRHVEEDDEQVEKRRKDDDDEGDPSEEDDETKDDENGSSEDGKEEESEESTY